MTRYLAFIFDDEAPWGDPDHRARGHVAHERFGAEHGPVLTGGAELAPVAASTTVRPDGDGGFTLTDGAFTEAKEVLGGYFVLRAPDRAAAVDLARQIPVLDGCHVVRDVVTRGDDDPTFMVLIHDRESAWADPDAAARGYAGHHAFMAAHAAAVVDGAELAPVATATVLRSDGGDGVTLTDGAFAETKEVLGGYYAFEADDLDAALAIARDVPRMGGSVELRPTGHITDR